MLAIGRGPGSGEKKRMRHLGCLCWIPSGCLLNGCPGTVLSGKSRCSPLSLVSVPHLLSNQFHKVLSLFSRPEFIVKFIKIDVQKRNRRGDINKTVRRRSFLDFRLFAGRGELLTSAAISRFGDFASRFSPLESRSDSLG